MKSGTTTARMRGLLPMLVAGALAGCAAPPAHEPVLPPMPEAASGYESKQTVSAQRFMVAAANPLATAAGYRVLKAGGSAVDAAIAVQMVLALVEPQSSGIGGGAFLMHADQGGRVQAWDGRETAPAAADENLFLLPDGKPMPFQAGVVGGRSVGVPGAVRMLERAHREHGLLPWALLFQPAIELASTGFPVSPRLHTLLKGERALRDDALARAYFYGPDGEPWPVGHVLRNPALAEVLRGIAARGSAALLEGPVAEDIVRRVRGHATNPGRLVAADLAGYQAREREPICTDWRATWRICGMPPPSSGHLAIVQMLKMLDALPPLGGPVLDGGVPSAPWLFRYAEVAQRAYADRAQYVADPDFVAAPGGRWTSLLDDAYLRARAAGIGEQATKSAPAGNPGGAPLAYAPQPAQPEYGTSHVSVVDAQGRAVAMTTTIEAVFGSRILSDGGTGQPGGFLLNNELTDFSFAPKDTAGRPIANRVQPGKRPRSSMSPTLVFDRRDGRLVMSVGSPGGAAIIHFTAKTLLGTLDWGLDPQAAIALPNFGAFNGPVQLEAKRFPPATVEALRARGHTVVEAEMTSGLQAIQRRGGQWVGGADPRREGVVLGD